MRVSWARDVYKRQDLKKDQESGLIEASRIFSKTQGIKICYLTVEEVVRHPLVQKIIEAYQ